MLVSTSPAPLPQASGSIPAAPGNPADQATVTIASNEPGADIEINGSFVGSTPTSVKLAPGQYNISVRRGTQVWQRSLQVNAGSAVTLNAQFESDNVTIRRSRN
jgi:uncharacterized protein YdgA (DUF945 family)